MGKACVMTWVYDFEAPVGTRILRSRFIGITTFDDFWWSDQYQKWTPSSEIGDMGGCSSYGCRSFKAFKKHLRDHPELRASKEVILVSRFMGYNITARWEN